MGNSEETADKNLDKMRDQLADIVMCALLFTHEMGIDIISADELKLVIIV